LDRDENSAKLIKKIYKARSQKGYYWYYKLQAKEPIFRQMPSTVPAIVGSRKLLLSTPWWFSP